MSGSGNSSAIELGAVIRPRDGADVFDTLLPKDDKSGRKDETVPMTNDTTTMIDERRSSQRFRISAPLTVIVGEHEIPAYTRDLSNRGVYFYLTLSDSTMIERDFEFLIEMPSEITLAANCRIRCRGRLVRKEVTSRNLTGAGIAAEILDYSILRESAASA